MIVRNKPSKDFTVLRNAVLERTDLSLKAKGLWAFLMSKPDGWRTTIHGLKSQLQEGERAIRGALVELTQAGLYGKRQISQGGTFVWEDYIYDEPQSDLQNAQLRNAVVRDAPLQKSPQVNTNRVKTEQVKTEKTVAKATAKRRDDIDRMFAYWAEATGIPIQASLQRNRYACANLLKRYPEEDLRRLVDGVAAAQGEAYAPKIADFTELQVKLNKLIVWGKQRGTDQTKQNSKYVVIS